MHVLRAGGAIGHLVDGVGLLEALLDIAELAMNVDIYIVAIGDALLVQDRRTRLHRGFRVEHGGQRLVLDLEQTTGGFGSALGLGHDGRDPLADEAHDIVENIGVVGVDEMVLVGRRRIELARHVLPREDGDDARHGKSRIALDGFDARMGMRRAQHFQVERILDGYVERIARRAGDDRFGEMDCGGSLHMPFPPHRPRR